ncbi:MAG: nickel pincer cofactor biosynthesis protein LarB [Deltaproteobacteria bacterium]|jgi:pyridinium-3,5-biscarboxylic acid mononucleotide synthase|nr:nickel pincer cofactor biosynthesis protein LarB [Deltaproteobacteria bacterium]MBT6503590.1 nickel pincer cofactor biosynthesis protein LarB [Deltaproteobacteria bacterium]MBT7151392.1 nickel pincer cofactor biosynthesis protein LarB [Deltaproteobacteria bacterium]
MNEEKIRDLLERLQAGEVDINDTVDQLKNLPYEDLGFAMIDHHRSLRKGHPETIFAAGKTPDQVAAIAEKMLKQSSNVLITRADRETYLAVQTLNKEAEYHELAKLITINQNPLNTTRSRILVMSAGTSDLPVCEEAAITAEMMGNSVERLYDVGVAGIHRLLNNRHRIDEASVLVVVAGMDGALPSVTAGLTDKPVIAVPTSVGYGASFGGLAALLTMLNSCACGVTVVNIDNGYGAGYAAAVINQIAEKAQPI